MSKGWCSVIDSTAFVKKHLKRAIENNVGGLIINDGGNFILADLQSFDCCDDDVTTTAIEINDPLKTLVSGADFVGAANGLVCVSKNEMNELLVFNPSTRKSIKIPSAPREFPRSFHMIETSLCGFGYDHVNDDYKVVKIAECYLQFRGKMVIVYSLKANSWTRVQNVPSSNTRFFGKWGMFANGALHWLALDNPVNGSDVIVGFDLGIEQFKEVPFPTIKRESVVNFNTVSVVSDGGSLYALDNYPNSRMDVWMMNNTSGQEYLWSKALSVDKSTNGTLGSYRFVRPVYFSKSGQSVILEVDGAKLMWYDLERKMVKNVTIRGISNKFDSHMYTESLIQLTEKKPLQKPSKEKPEMKQQTSSDDFLSRGFKLRL